MSTIQDSENMGSKKSPRIRTKLSHALADTMNCLKIQSARIVKYIVKKEAK